MELAAAERDRTAFASHLDSERSDFISSLAEIRERADRALDALDAVGLTSKAAAAGVFLSPEEKDRLQDSVKDLYRYAHLQQHHHHVEAL